MATDSRLIVFKHTTDAEFRTWVGEVLAGLLASGATQSGDTGQIDPATVLRPAVNTEGGYAMFAFTDTLQGTAPKFLRLGFGTAGTNQMRLQVQAGNGTNGSGTLTGNVSDVVTHTVSDTATPSKCFFSCGADRITAAIHLTVTPFLFNFERTHNADGASTDVGAWLGVANNNNPPFQTRYSEVIPSAGLRWGSESSWMGCCTTRASSIYGTTVAVYPVFPLLCTIMNPSPNVLLYRVGDITAETEFDATLYGAPHHYLTLGAFPVAAIGTGHLAMIWE